jgi:DNA-binding CsgD family transcriptional regulator
MHSWHQDLLNLLVTPVTSPQTIFANIERTACKLGFEHVAYGYQAPYPVTQPPVTTINNYPLDWQTHYHHSGYMHTDPAVLHGRRSTMPLVWSQQTFASNPSLWQDAQDHGIRTGWGQSSIEANGSGSLLCVCRSHEPITPRELQAKEQQMRWLVQVAHISLSRALVTEQSACTPTLTARERETLQWTADGKSAQDIADILTLSKSAVDFHIANSMRKLNTPNKTAAVAKAIQLGWLR